MNRGLVAGIFFFGAAAATAGCVDDATNDLEVRTSALGGFNGTTVASAVRAFRRSDNVYEGVFRSRVGGAVQVTGNPFNASRVMASNVVATSTPWVFQRSLDKATVAYVSADQHVHVVAEQGTGGTSGMGMTAFQDVDYALAPRNAPLAAAPVGTPVPDVIGYARSDGKVGVVYRTTDNHIEEILFNAIGLYVISDLTVSSGALVTATTGSPFPYVRSDGYNTVVYIGSDNQIHELSTLGTSGSATGPWSDSNLSVNSGDLVAPSSEPWGYQRGDSCNSVIYIATDGLLHELFLFPGGSWGSAVLPAVSPTVSLTARPAGYIRPEGYPAAVVYRSTTGIVHEMTLGTGGWVDAVVPVPAGIAPLEQMFAHQAPTGKSSLLFAGTQSGGMHGYRMSRNSGSGWLLQDTIF